MRLLHRFLWWLMWGAALLLAPAAAHATELPRNPYRAPLLDAVRAAGPARYDAARRSLAATCQAAGKASCDVDAVAYAAALSGEPEAALQALEAAAAQAREELVFAACAFQGRHCVHPL